MKQIEKTELSRALIVLGKLVSRTSPLECFRSLRLQSEGASLRLSAYSLNETFSVLLPVLGEPEPAPCDWNVNFAELKEALKGSASGIVTFQEKQGTLVVTMESGRQHTASELPLLAIEWPEWEAATNQARDRI